MVCSHSLFLLLYSSPLCNISQTVYSSTVDGHLGHFQFRATVNNTAIIFFSVFFGARMNAFLFGMHLRLDFWDMGT